MTTFSSLKSKYDDFLWLEWEKELDRSSSIFDRFESWGPESFLAGTFRRWGRLLFRSCNVEAWT